MKAVKGLPRACPIAPEPQIEPFALVFDGEVPNFDTDDWGQRYRAYYHEQAVRIVDALQKGIPGGLFDHVSAELMRRQSSVYRVPHPALNAPQEPSERKE